MTPEAAEQVLADLRLAQKLIFFLGEKMIRWEASESTMKELAKDLPYVPESDVYGEVKVWGAPVRIVDDAVGWSVVSHKFVTMQVRRRRVPAFVVAKGDAPLEILEEQAPLPGSIASFYGVPKHLLPSIAELAGMDSGEPEPTADLSQIEADLQALAAKQPAPAPPAPTASAYIDEKHFWPYSPKSVLSAAMTSLDLKKVADDMLASMKASPLPLHSELGLKLPDPPLYPPDPAVTKAAAKAVMKAAEQIAAALSTGDLPVPPQAHHATVGEITVHLSVDIAKEITPWKL